MIKEKLAHFIFMLTACVSIFAVLLICLFLFMEGVPAIREIGAVNFLTGETWQPLAYQFGILPMIVGSIYVTVGAVAVGAPLGIMTAVFLTFYCPKRLCKLMRLLVNVLAGIPSVIYGFFGLTVLVPMVQKLGGSGKGILTASLLLGIMILPTIISVSESALRAVPTSYYDGAVALGATHEQGIFSTVIPAAKRGLASATILGIGRAVGETLAVSMIAGNQAALPNGILDGVRTLTANIVLEMGYAADLHKGALMGTAVVLFLLIMIINACFLLIKGGD